MTLTACYVVCNEAAEIANSLRSVKEYVDRYVIVDSVFDTNPLEATHSTDATREVCERVCAPVPLTYIESDRKLTQVEARNLALAQVPVGEWVLIIDGDETLCGHHPDIVKVVHGLRLATQPIAIAVYTFAVRFDGQAPEMDAHTFSTAPLIATVGDQHRLYRIQPRMRYRYPIGGGTPGVYLDDSQRWLWSPERTSTMFLINDHPRQTFENYLNDYVWETGILRQVHER